MGPTYLSPSFLSLSFFSTRPPISLRLFFPFFFSTRPSSTRPFLSPIPRPSSPSTVPATGRRLRAREQQRRRQPAGRPCGYLRLSLPPSPPSVRRPSDGATALHRYRPSPPPPNCLHRTLCRLPTPLLHRRWHPPRRAAGARGGGGGLAPSRHGTEWLLVARSVPEAKPRPWRSSAPARPRPPSPDLPLRLVFSSRCSSRLHAPTSTHADA